jgi:hypothetical protein
MFEVQTSMSGESYSCSGEEDGQRAAIQKEKEMIRGEEDGQ